MHYFILEDDMARIRLFREYYDVPGNLVVICTNVEDAKRALSERTYDVISLDHDLGGRVYVPSHEPNTGYSLAKWMAENNIQCRKKIIIHSFNSDGAEAMKKVLPQAQWIPFNLVRSR
jgi:hypothetical protein